MNQRRSPTEWVMRKMTCEQGSLINSYNMLVDIGKICLVQPLPNAMVERGASTLKRIKTRLRNSMKNDMLSCLMNISINGPKLKSEYGNALIEEADRTYRSLHKTNLPSLYLPKVEGVMLETQAHCNIRCLRTFSSKSSRRIAQLGLFASPAVGNAGIAKITHNSLRVGFWIRRIWSRLWLWVWLNLNTASKSVTSDLTALFRISHLGVVLWFLNFVISCSVKHSCSVQFVKWKINLNVDGSFYNFA